MTYHGAAGGGLWNAESTWEEGSGYPGSGDNVVLDSGSGNIDVNVDSACLDIDCTGYTGTLHFSADLTVYGSLTFSSGMTTTFDQEGGYYYFKIIMAATTTGHTIKRAGQNMGVLVFDGVGGEWTLQDNFTVDGYPAEHRFLAGTLNLNGYEIYCNGTIPSGFTINVGTGALGVGWYILAIGDGAVVNVSSGSITDGGTITVSGTGILNCTGAAYIRCGDFHLGSGFSGDSATIEVYGSSLESVNPIGNLRIGWNWFWGNINATLASDLEVLGDVTICKLDSWTAKLLLDSHKLTVGGNWTNDDAFDAGTGTVEFNDDSKVSIVGGSSTTTFNVLKCATPGKTVKFKAGATLYCSSFDFDGAAGDLITLDTDTGSGTWTISDSDGTNSVTYCHIHRSAATGGATFEALTSNGNEDAGGNTGWVFTGESIVGPFPTFRRAA